LDLANPSEPINQRTLQSCFAHHAALFEPSNLWYDGQVSMLLVLATRHPHMLPTGLPSPLERAAHHAE
jgi:hypothetical protein